MLYDVSTLHFEIDEGDGFRKPGFSKERRLDPQVTIGLLTDACGFPLMVNAFGGQFRSGLMLRRYKGPQGVAASRSVRVSRSGSGSREASARCANSFMIPSTLRLAVLPKQPFLICDGRVAHAAFPKGCLAIRLRDELGELFQDKDFTGLLAVRGR